jgi:DnaJ-class molecular chaperone
MSQPDFHQILGIPPSASAAEIKRAFKRLAMRWHPDRNADPQAHEQFRLAREAFEHLTGLRETDPPVDAEEKPPAQRPKGDDRRLDVDLDLKEAAFGGIVTVTLEGRATCVRPAKAAEDAATAGRPCAVPATAAGASAATVASSPVRPARARDTSPTTVAQTVKGVAGIHSTASSPSVFLPQ